MTDDPSKTGEILDKPTRPGTFKKGYDPRRNLRGVPASAIAARKAVRRLGAELVHIKERVYDPDSESWKEVEYDITRYEAMVRLMFSSKAPKDREMLLKILAPGLLIDEIDVKSGGEKIVFEVVNANAKIPDNPADASPEAEKFPGEPGKA